MFETARKAFLAGLGTLDLTEENLQAFFDDLIKRGELSEQEARAYAQQWRQRFAERRAELGRQVRDAVLRALRGLNLATREELEEVTRRVDALEQQALVGHRHSADWQSDAEC